MTAAARRGIVAAGAGLMALLAFGVLADRAQHPSGAVAGVTLPPSCSSCDARHANLRDRQVTLAEVQE